MTRSKPSTNGSANDNPNGRPTATATSPTSSSLTAADGSGPPASSEVPRRHHRRGLSGLTVDPSSHAHQMRHTWATELANAGMSIQALMTLLGHRSPEMTIRDARLASPALTTADDQAAGKIARRIPVASAGRTAVPDRIEWLASEMLKPV